MVRAAPLLLFALVCGAAARELQSLQKMGAVADGAKDVAGAVVGAAGNVAGAMHDAFHAGLEGLKDIHEAKISGVREMFDAKMDAARQGGSRAVGSGARSRASAQGRRAGRAVGAGCL